MSLNSSLVFCWLLVVKVLHAVLWAKTELTLTKRTERDVTSLHLTCGPAADVMMQMRTH